MNNQQIVSLLNDLLQITNDRIEGFSKVEGKVWEMYPDIKDEYDRMISQSKIMKNELINLITEKNGNPDDSTSIAGAFHRIWIDVKNSFTIGTVEDSTLENVIFGEKAAVEAYQKALQSGNLDQKSAKTVSDQLHHLKESYQEFKKIEEYKKNE